jgi:putative membrane protein insertion efficiency factor
LLKRFIIFLITLYQKYISPMKSAQCCRFYPTCSQYAIDAVTRFGVIKGCFKALIRLLKCHPFHPGGYDPVRDRELRK